MTSTATETAEAPAAAPLVGVRGIVKRFPGVIALRDVSLDIARGEIHGLVGENGAGKSTLIKILSGAYAPDEGTVLIAGQEVALTNPHVAQGHGITTIHQELTLAPDLTALENIFLGREIARGSTILSDREMESRVLDLCDAFDFAREDLHRPIEHFGALKKHVVMLLKALAFQAELVIMDEPTAGLTDSERHALFAHMRQLKERGVSALWVTHRLDELVGMADRASVLRDGALVGSIVPSESELDAMIKMMVGREVETIEELVEEAADSEEAGPASTSDVVLRVENLTRRGVLDDVSFEVRGGEILGIGGLAGAGRSELAHAIMGADPVDSGYVFLDGEAVRFASPRDAYRAGVALVPEDRKTQGILPDFSLAENVSMAALWRILRGRFVIDRRRESGAARDSVKELQIRTPSIRQKIAFLSGGNQQKTIIARALFARPKVLILDEPTQGIDVGAKVEVFKLIIDHANEGGSVIVISSEIPELLGLSDRIVVMREGRIVGEMAIARAHWTPAQAKAHEERLLAMATGAAGGGPDADA